MRGEREVESAAVQIINHWVLTATYSGKTAIFHDSQEERLKLVITSALKSNGEEYMHTFEVASLAQCGIIDPKEFKTLKEFFHYLKFNGEQIRYRQLLGEAQLLVQYVNMRKEKMVARIKGGKRFVAEPQSVKQQRVDISIKEEQKRLQELQEQSDQRRNSVYGQNVLLVQRIEDIVNINDKNPTQLALSATKIILRFCEMDVNSPGCQMRNDREIDRLVIQKIIKVLPQLNNLQQLIIQWYKLSTDKVIQQIIRACSSLHNLRVLSFDNQGNAFDTALLTQINTKKFTNLQQVTCFFNISDEDSYFEESWWHPEHTEKYKGKEPIPSQEWLRFIDSNKEMDAIWIGGGGSVDIELLMRRSWRKLALGYYEDQTMDAKYWQALKAMPSENTPNKLISLCLTRIKNIDNEALKTVILSNTATLQHFALNWCNNESDDALSALQQCKLKSICLRHSALQENTVIRCSFLKSSNMASLQSLYIQNFTKAKQSIFDFLSKQYDSLRALSLPRNQWLDSGIFKILSKRRELVKLNLYNCKLLSKQDSKPAQAIQCLRLLGNLQVLNLGATDLELSTICQIIKPLTKLRKLNISDRKIPKTLNKAFYDGKHNQINYPLTDRSEPKAYQKLNTQQKNEFMTRIANKQLAEVLHLIPRVTHLDIRNIGCDERPFANLKLLPRLRLLGCEFELYKQVQSLERRGLTFV